MFGEKRTKLGDTLRLRFRRRELHCEVIGPNPKSGYYWLKFRLYPSDEGTADGADIGLEMEHDVRSDLAAHGISADTIACGYSIDEKHYVLLAPFPPKELMAAYKFQLSFGQQDRGRA